MFASVARLLHGGPRAWRQLQARVDQIEQPIGWLMLLPRSKAPPRGLVLFTKPLPMLPRRAVAPRWFRRGEDAKKRALVMFTSGLEGHDAEA